MSPSRRVLAVIIQHCGYTADIAQPQNGGSWAATIRGTDATLTASSYYELEQQFREVAEVLADARRAP